MTGGDACLSSRRAWLASKPSKRSLPRSRTDLRGAPRSLERSPRGLLSVLRSLHRSRADANCLAAPERCRTRHSGRDLRTSPSTSDSRPLLWAAKAAWGTLYSRIESVTKLNEGDAPEVASAKAIIAGLFPSGLDFANGDAETLWLRGQHTLDAIARLGFTDAVDQIAGHFVVRAVRARHHALGVAIGRTGSIRPEGEVAKAPVDRRALLDAVTASIARYAHLVTAVDMSDASPVKAAEKALQPLVKFPSKAKSSRAASDEGDDDATQEKTVTQQGAANDTAAPKRNVA